MANEVVKYHNDLNMVSLQGWKKNEVDFFFAILSKAKEKGCEWLYFDTDELKILCDFRSDGGGRWNEVLQSTQKKIVSMYYWEKTEKSSIAMTLFSFFKIDYKNHSVELKVSDNFEYILNRINANFTRFELEEFVGIRSTYAKTMYRILKQWRTQGEHEFDVAQFRFILGIPETYNTEHINQRVLAPILKELPSFFPNLKCKKIKKRTKGSPIIAYKFTWDSTNREDIEREKLKFSSKHEKIKYNTAKNMRITERESKPVDQDALNRIKEWQKNCQK